MEKNIVLKTASQPKPNKTQSLFFSSTFFFSPPQTQTTLQNNTHKQKNEISSWKA
jgi:hypothetical protein